MKKAMLVLTTVLLFGILSSCSKDDDVAVKKTWIFTFTVATTYSPASSLFEPETITTTQEAEMTEAEADAYIKTKSTVVLQTVGGITMKIVTTVTKTEKK